MRNATDLLVQYATYHRDRRNIVTHFFGIPMIVCAIGALLSKPVWADVAGVAVTPALIGAAIITLWYLSRHLVLGLATALVFDGLFALGAHLAAPSTSAWLVWGLGQFFVGWVVQFIGHYYEGRKPAFVDDLIGLLVGPMFVVAEWLFAAGWNKPLHAEVVKHAGPTMLRDLKAGKRKAPQGTA